MYDKERRGVKGSKEGDGEGKHTLKNKSRADATTREADPPVLLHALSEGEVVHKILEKRRGENNKQVNHLR